MQKECARVISAERSFWLQWVAATTIGSRIGGAISGPSSAAAKPASMLWPLPCLEPWLWG